MIAAPVEKPTHFALFLDCAEFLATHVGGDVRDYHLANEIGIARVYAAAKEAGIEEQARAVVERSLSMTATIVASVQRMERAAASRNTPPLPEPPRIVALEIGELLTRDFPPMEVLLAPWLRKQNLVMVHAKRGVGKTHFAFGVAYAVAGGGAYLKWRAEKPRKVLYIDGEMPGAAMKERAAALVAGTPEGAEPPQGFLRIITPDVQDRPLPDLATADGQDAFAPLLGDADLIVVDNLSSLIRAAVENEGEGWLPVAAWALARRREGRAVLFVHHSGKGGAQRGTSRREDLLDIVIRLDHPPDYDPARGASFRVSFEKSRGIHGDDVREFEATLGTDAGGLQTWSYKDTEGATLDRVVDLQKLGMSQGEIAVELRVNKSTVCRAMKRAREDGLIPKNEARK